MLSFSGIEAAPCAGALAEPGGELLREIEDRDQQKLQRDWPATPLRAALRSGDETAGAGAHDDGGTGDEQEPAPVQPGGQGG